MKELLKELRYFENSEYYREIIELLLQIIDLKPSIDRGMLCAMFRCNHYNHARLVRALERLLSNSVI